MEKAELAGSVPRARQALHLDWRLASNLRARVGFRAKFRAGASIDGHRGLEAGSHWRDIRGSHSTAAGQAVTLERTGSDARAARRWGPRRRAASQEAGGNFADAGA